MTASRVFSRPSFDDLVSPFTGLPLWVHSAQEYEAARHRIAEVRRQANLWQAQVILAEAIRVFEGHPWVGALRLNTDGTRDGIVSSASLRAVPVEAGGVPVPEADARHEVENRVGEVFASVCPYADETVFGFADEWFDRTTYLTTLGIALGLPMDASMDAFVDRCRTVQGRHGLAG